MSEPRSALAATAGGLLRQALSVAAARAG
jgi:hypothetical protein